MTKIIFLLTFTQFYAVFSLAQLKLEDFKNIKLATQYQDIESRDKIIDMFVEKDKEYVIFKGDFLNTYKITFENTPFDYYGEADYTFQYVKDTLTDIEVDYNFPAYKLQDFERFLRQLVSDLNSDPDKTLYRKTNTLNIEKSILVSKNECRVSDDYHNFNGRLLGGAVWAIKTNYPNENRRLVVETHLSTGQHRFKDNKYPYKLKNYSGSWMTVKLILLNEKTVDLYILNENQANSSYTGILKYYDKKLINWDADGNPIVKESSNSIPLKEKNGVYKLPVRLNNVLTLDFILDLGASDVLLSQDVFLTLYRSGTIAEDDFVGNQTYQIADGSIVKSRIINIKSLTIGGKKITNVRASISKSIDSPLLLGQSAMKQLKNYKIDVDKKLLIIE